MKKFARTEKKTWGLDTNAVYGIYFHPMALKNFVVEDPVHKTCVVLSIYLFIVFFFYFLCS